jgi:hypothetical protein
VNAYRTLCAQFPPNGLSGHSCNTSGLRKSLRNQADALLKASRIIGSSGTRKTNRKSADRNKNESKPSKQPPTFLTARLRESSGTAILLNGLSLRAFLPIPPESLSRSGALPHIDDNQPVTAVEIAHAPIQLQPALSTGTDVTPAAKYCGFTWPIPSLVLSRLFDHV